MILFTCDWCGNSFGQNRINNVTIRNVYNGKLRLHICRQCGKKNFPESVQAYMSWTDEIL